ncbi:MAG: Pr6Pr family membrane protein [Chloroflexota bacterium]
MSTPITLSQTDKTVQTIGKIAAIFGLLTLVLQFYINVTNSFNAGKGMLNAIEQFISFFTITTNIYATLTLAAHGRANLNSKFWRFFRHPSNLTSVAASIMVVCSIFHFVLRNPAGLQGLNYWVDLALHYINPFLTVIFWWLALPRGNSGVNRKSWGYLLWYPLYYLIYVFVRGTIVNSYPYFFINVNNLGYPLAFRNAGGITLLLISLVLFFSLINRIAGRKINR